MLQNLSSAKVVIGPLRIKQFIFWAIGKQIIM